MKPFKWKYFPYYIFGLVGIFILLDIGYILLSTMAYSGAYSEATLPKGIDFNQVNANSLNLSKANYITDISYNDGKITVKVQAAGAPVTGADVKVKVARLVSSKFDEIVQLNDIGNGFYSAAYVFKSAGQWELRIKITHGNVTNVIYERIKV